MASTLQPSLFLCVLFAAMILILPCQSVSQSDVQISDFSVFDWFRSVKLTWKVTAPEGSDATLEILRSDQEDGPYAVVHEIQLGDKAFIDVITKSYVYIDKKLQVGRKYYYKLSLQGTNQVFGPLRGLASGAPPGT
jgi:hypothetical protein